MIAGYPLPVVVLAGGMALLGLVALDWLLRRADGAWILLVIVYGGLTALFDAQSTFTGTRTTLTDAQVLTGRLGTLLVLVGLPFVLARPARRPAGLSLWLGACALVMATWIAEMLAIAGFRFSQAAVLSLLTFTALLAAPRLDPQAVARVAKWALAAAFIASAAVVAVGAAGAWRELEGQSVLPVLPLRLQGIFPHPNTLGPAALLFLILERISPSSPRWRPWAIGGALLLLALSQSKTAWVIAIAVAGVAFYCDQLRGRDEVRTVPLAAAALMVLAALVYFGLTESAEELLQEAPGFGEAGTLTGRTDLWREGLEAWRGAPVEGVPGFFEDYARRTDQAWAGQGHNQAVDTLTEHGLLGLAGLAAYIGVLLAYAWRHRDASCYASVMLVVLLALRSVTETPLDEITLEHLCVVALLLAWERQSRSAPLPLRQPSSADPAADAEQPVDPVTHPNGQVGAHRRSVSVAPPDRGVESWIRRPLASPAAAEPRRRDPGGSSGRGGGRLSA